MNTIFCQYYTLYWSIAAGTVLQTYLIQSPFQSTDCGGGGGELQDTGKDKCVTVFKSEIPPDLTTSVWGCAGVHARETGISCIND